METKTLIIIIICLAALMFFICKSKSKFETTTESTSTIPEITTDSVIIFYAPWCGHCTKSKPAFEKAVELGQGTIIMIDATENKELAEKHGVTGFPTIIKNGEIYSGAREAESILEFSKK